ncbi:hypothetical protein LVJ59_16290 [Microbacterium sp. KKR3/1]|uniref:hypothetical protein n=1 Tax=Microbacterium sp. KKR3/1 TaxID=2904241 RepID=UPI001E28FAB4|nr:hypothetical protein [Microbacterium sp. KKR3/1]MCE0510609.1 hypothetical protein [Microbacterium sp. KKR3/1]
MVVGSVELVEVSPREVGVYWQVFAPSAEFPAPWWEEEHRVDDGRWLSGRRAGVEVVRCKFILDEGPLSHPLLGSMPDGQLDILAFEVALSARRQGVGRATTLAIREMYPTPRLTALNDNATSRHFWDGIGWVRHQPSNPLFAGVERVTYSEV